MELDKVEYLLEKYFEGNTETLEEFELKYYFSTSNVAPHLEQYRPLFNYLFAEEKRRLTQEIKLPAEEKNNKKKTWFWSVAASVAVLLSVSTYTYYNANQTQDLGTYDNPEVAFRETQKALALLSSKVNTGIESVQYVQEYENSKNLIFKQQ